jgi:lysophospholipase L1-like esterase
LLVPALLAEAFLRLFGHGILPGVETYSTIERRSGYVVNGQPFRTFPFWRPDNHYAFKLKEGIALDVVYRDQPLRFSFQTNSQGFRNPEKVIQPGTRSVMVLGDSLVFGHGVNDTETLPSVLAKRFSAERVDFMNFGVGAWSLAEYYLTYQKYAKELDPALVLIVIYTGNDLYEFERTDWRGRETGALPTAPLRRYDYGFDSDGQLVTESLAYKLPVLRNSLLWVALDKYLFSKARELAHAGRVERHARSNIDASIDLIKSIAAERRTMVVVIPVHTQPAPQELLRGLRTVPGILLLDLQNAVSEWKKELTTYYIPDGVHFTLKGNEAVAQVIELTVRQANVFSAR